MLGKPALVAFIPSTDLQRSRAFYGGVLEFSLIDGNPFADVFDAGGTTLRVTKVDGFTPHGFTALGWTVPDIAAEVSALVARGVGFERFDGMDQDDSGIWLTPGGDRVAWFKDPDANLLSLTQPAPS